MEDKQLGFNELTKMLDETSKKMRELKDVRKKIKDQIRKLLRRA